MTDSPLFRSLRAHFRFGFHLSGKARERFGVADLLEAAGGEAAAAPLAAVRLLAHRVNLERLRPSGRAGTVEAGQLECAGLIIDALRYLAHHYCYGENPGSVAGGMRKVGARKGPSVIERPGPAFAHLYPPEAVARGRRREDRYLSDSTRLDSGAAAPNRELVVLELILLSLAMSNPAFRPLWELFDDAELKQAVPYQPLVDGLEEFFRGQPKFSLFGLTLFECLRAPMLASPDSLEGQLAYIKQHWSKFLPEELLERIVMAQDVLAEEVRMRGLGPGPAPVLEFGRGGFGAGKAAGADADWYPAPAAFSSDADWMSNVVIIAKSVYVWLDQLSKKYGRPARSLSDVPDQELDLLARWGFTGLWLIGLWERSPASEKIKKLMGNPEAAASAYSLYDYTIAADLGGEPAYENLRDRASRRGIRLASDMVPNHTGVYSKWMIEHPDWFLQLDRPPYPWYLFSGADLSGDPRVSIQIEDGYWERRDAAVVFRRHDRATGETRYIYHGNDGTTMPWNDTAQLDFRSPEVREAIIDTIIHVARKFNIIRFDAAMTLAKQHYQRLWFPKPGDGGAIPSRAEHGMTREEFDRHMPGELWREVVDRVMAQVPDTLLMAEAFWLMEGYFVRTLGMHRVYNSAFMNMLKTEDNQKYRDTIKNVLEFSPEIAKRFVNFMNNPDEDTAVAQFGKGDKYIGVCLLMVTMPGLPMFGHGQIEGLTEKYGMEYRRAYWDESPDQDLIQRHEREIFPLLRRRALFSGAENFALYDFVADGGRVDENVFAYSNRHGDQRALILYNNAYATTAGWIKTSTARNVGGEDERKLVARGLAEALALNTAPAIWYRSRESRSGLEFLRAGAALAEQGMFAQLGGYQYQAFLDFREFHDGDGSWARLAQKLQGAGVPSLDQAYRELALAPVVGAFRAALSADNLRGLVAGEPAALTCFQRDVAQAVAAAAAFAGAAADADALARQTIAEVERIVALEPGDEPGDDEAPKPVLIATSLVRALGAPRAPGEARPSHLLAAARLEEWMLGPALSDALAEFGGDRGAAQFDATLVAVLLRHDDLLAPPSAPAAETPDLAERWAQAFEDPAVRAFLCFNLYQGEVFFNQEQLERMLAALSSARRAISDPADAEEETAPSLVAEQILAAAHAAGYKVRPTLALLQK